jgi:hypothetical protein
MFHDARSFDQELCWDSWDASGMDSSDEMFDSCCTCGGCSGSVRADCPSPTRAPTTSPAPTASPAPTTARAPVSRGHAPLLSPLALLVALAWLP